MMIYDLFLKFYQKENGKHEGNQVKITLSLLKIVFLFLINLMPSKYAISLAKKLKIDVRFFWNSTRHYFIGRDIIDNKNPLLIVAKLFFFYFRFPKGLGLPWGCAMESAYRIFNLILLQQYAQSRIVKSITAIMLRLESRYIANNLETESQNNHYLFNLIGLLLVRETNKYCPVDEKWLSSEFRSQFIRQFYDDGANFESSSAYHALALEAIAIVYLSCPEEAQWIDGNVKELLQKAWAFFLIWQDDLQSMGYYGDNDSGYAFFAINPHINYHLFQKDFIATALGMTKVIATQVQLYPTAGIMSIVKNNNRLVVIAGAVGQNGKGGHSHNDKCSLMLWIKGQYIFGDPGTASYAVNRNRYRQTAHHSTVQLNSREQNTLSSGVFKMPDATKATMVCKSDSELAVTHTGFEPHTLTREFCMSADGLQVTDSFFPALMNHDIASTILISPFILTIEEGGLNAWAIRLKGEEVLRLVVYSTTIAEVDLVPYAKYYGDNIGQGTRLCFKWPQGLSVFRWELKW